jgi:hypothetical protein
VPQGVQLQVLFPAPKPDIQSLTAWEWHLRGTFVPRPLLLAAWTPVAVDCVLVTTSFYRAGLIEGHGLQVIHDPRCMCSSVDMAHIDRRNLQDGQVADEAAKPGEAIAPD